MDKNMEKRVVVTGLGVLAAVGNDISSFWESLKLFRIFKRVSKQALGRSLTVSKQPFKIVLRVSRQALSIFDSLRTSIGSFLRV